MKIWQRILFVSLLVTHPLFAQENTSAQQESQIITQYRHAETLYNTGKHGQAYIQFQQLLDISTRASNLSSVELAAIAEATVYLGATDPQLFKRALQLYDRAIAADENNLDAQIAAGELLLDKYNNSEALDAFRTVLKIDPDNPKALLGLARSQHFDHSPEALATVNKVLAIAPDSIPAKVFLTRLLIELEQYEDAKRQAEQALAINEQSLPALAILATVHYLTGDDNAFQDTVDRALIINPRYADLYNTLAELAVQNRLYDDAVKFARQAVKLDQQSWRGYSLLGTNQMRIGAIEQGLANLQIAFAGDPYNLWVKNTLDLADTFPEYETVTTESFILTVHKDEAELLTPYILDLAEQALDYYQQRYDYQPKLPIRIEFYPRHADFSVRTLGLAGLGILGVSFGPVVAMDSPSARRIGSFNWGSTLWHELAHTFHLGMTYNRAPRWFSEGLAVHEEHLARTGWGGDVDPEFLLAYKEDKLLPVSELNNGFVRPSYPDQVIHSYYQASLVFEFIENRWGSQVINEMMAGFKQRLNTAAVIEQVLDITMAEFDQAFDEFFQQRFKQPLAALDGTIKPPQDKAALTLLAEVEADNFIVQLNAGRAFLVDEDFEQAEQALLKAQVLFPEYAGEASPYMFLASLYEQRGDIAKAAEQLQMLVAINAEHFNAHTKLAQLQRQLGNNQAAAETLHAAAYIYPMGIELHQDLAELYSGLENWPLAVQERRAIVALKPVDMAEARYQLANAHFNNDDLSAARREILRTLEIAPNYAEAQDLLLAIRARKQQLNSKS